MHEYTPSPQIEDLLIRGLKRVMAGDEAGGKQIFGEVLAEAARSGEADKAGAAQTIAQTCEKMQLASIACDYYVEAANAARRTASSVIVCSSNSATIAPLRMTSTRWARPSTSSCSEEIRRTAMPSAASEWISS